MTSSDTWYEDDASHPVSCVGTVDTYVTTEEGSTYYGLVVAEPMHGDQRSQQRLLQKLENYIADRFSEASLKQFGRPTPSNTHLTVAIHPQSSKVVFELLQRCEPWVTDNGFSFEITSDAQIFSLQQNAS